MRAFCVEVVPVARLRVGYCYVREGNVFRVVEVNACCAVCESVGGPEVKFVRPRTGEVVKIRKPRERVRISRDSEGEFFAGPDALARAREAARAWEGRRRGH